MLTLSAEGILEKNKLISDGVWLPLVEIILVDPTTTLRLVQNTDNITWNGETWVAFPFDLGDTTEDSKGALPSIQLTVSNVTRAIQYYLEEGNGAVGATVTIRVVHSKHLDLTTPEIEETFSILSPKVDANNVVFDLGSDYPISARRPEKRIMKNFCPFVYGGPECAVAAGTLIGFPTCGKTLTDCRARKNSVRFGGEPSIPTGGGLYV